jgi:hypothetical protein
MAVEVIWRAAPLVSHLHAAEALSHARPPADSPARPVADSTARPLADGRLAEALHVPSALLAAEIRSANLPATRFWAHLIPLAANLDVRRQLVETAVVKTAGRSPRLEAIVSTVASAVAAVEAAGNAALPNLAEELELRQRPLREQWEARGSGLMQHLGCLTDPALVVEGCPVLLVHPALGGGGAAHLRYNSVRIEAVLANPVAELPEVVRLAWLIAQLHLDLPAWSEAIHAARLPHIAAYAMLPAVLAAAEYVELARLTPETLRLAIEAWRLAVPPGVDAATLISDWWQTYQADRPPWRVALQALDQMFG